MIAAIVAKTLKVLRTNLSLEMTYRVDNRSDVPPGEDERLVPLNGWCVLAGQEDVSSCK